MLARDDALERLATQQFDLLVIGGGALGCSVAHHAARMGLSVAVVEQHDLCSHTSSASSKLIHGGLRYLQMGDLRLVREAHQERHALATVVAPQLVRPRRFVFPLYRGGPVHPYLLRPGLVLYGALGGFKEGAGGMLSPQAAKAKVPALKMDRLRSAGTYTDHETNDARLALLTAKAAASHGAGIVTRMAVEGFQLASGKIVGAHCRDSLTGAAIDVSARAVVNATGPWVDHIRRLADPGARPSVQLSKGAHVVVDGGVGWEAAVIAPLTEGRVQFANPWEGMLLVGTTDEAYEGDPALVSATDADVDQILRETATALEPGTVTREGIRFRYAGLRVLPLGDAKTASARREVVFERDSNGMLSIAGGKWTTYRRIGLDALERLRDDLGFSMLARDPVPLPGACDPVVMTTRLQREHPALETTTIDHLVRSYGSTATTVLEPARERPELLEPITIGTREIAAEVVHARDAEWAIDADDVMRRRTTLSVRGYADAARARVEELLST